jgi:acyl carrier protein
MNVQSDPTFAAVSAVMTELFRIPAGRQVGPETTSSDVDGWDSLSHAVLIMKLEETFGFDLPLDRVYALKNVGELVELLRELGADKERT